MISQMLIERKEIEPCIYRNTNKPDGTALSLDFSRRLRLNNASATKLDVSVFPVPINMGRHAFDLYLYKLYRWVSCTVPVGPVNEITKGIRSSIWVRLYTIKENELREGNS